MIQLNSHTFLKQLLHRQQTSKAVVLLKRPIRFHLNRLLLFYSSLNPSVSVSNSGQNFKTRVSGS